MKKWKTLSSKISYENPFLRVRQDTVENSYGRVIEDYFLWEQGNVALVVAVTKENKFVLVKQYKHAVADIIIEFSAGMIEKDEEPLAAAKRELQEETGYVSNDFTFLGTLVNNPTKVIGKIFVFLAKNAEKTEKTAFDTNESIQTLLVDAVTLTNMIAQGTFFVSGSVAAFFLAKQKINP